MARSTISFAFVAAVAFLAACNTLTGTEGATQCATGIICPVDTTCAAIQAVCITTPCGNGLVDPGEQCDDGNIMAADGCSATCQFEKCGNGTPDPGELCDDGNTADGDGCAHDCLSLETCGNNIKDINEAC